MKAPRTVLILTCLLAGISLRAKDISVLFVGNSYTYSPGSETRPGLPERLKRIAESIDPNLKVNYTFNTPGGYSFERHFKNPTSLKLMEESYDHVILQGQSIESLELTPWFKQQGFPDVQSFGIYLPKVLERVFQNNKKITLFVNWGWSPKHPFLQEDHPGLHFPEGTPKAGQKWAGENKFAFQRMINESYAKHSQGYPVKLAYIGTAWLSLQVDHYVTEEELYVEHDWSHPTLLGSFIAAAVLAKETLALDLTKNQYVPDGVDPRQARKILDYLAK